MIKFLCLSISLELLLEQYLAIIFLFFNSSKLSKPFFKILSKLLNSVTWYNFLFSSLIYHIFFPFYKLPKYKFIFSNKFLFLFRILLNIFFHLEYFHFFLVISTPLFKKKNGILFFLHFFNKFSTHSFTSLALTPDSPPTITQSILFKLMLSKSSKRGSQDKNFILHFIFLKSSILLKLFYFSTVTPTHILSVNFILLDNSNILFDFFLLIFERYVL